MTYFDEPQSLAEIKNELRKIMAASNDPYAVAFYGINMRYTFTINTEFDEGFAEFLSTYILNRYDLEDFLLETQESDVLNSFLQMLLMYYLLSEETRQFRKIVNWLPDLAAKQKQIILSWPEKMVFSIFNTFVENDSVYYQDVKDDEIYPISFTDSEMPVQLAKINTALLTFLVPTDTGYFSPMALSCQPDESLKKALNAVNSKRDGERAVINWFCDTAQEFSGFSDEVFEQDFYSAARRKNESTTDFARRLLAQDDKIIHFKYYDQFEALTIKVIDTFPQMFFSASNAFPLLLALEQLFTVESETDDLFDPNYLPDFWGLLIREHLPKELKKIESCRVSEDYWDEDDFELDLGF